MGVLAEQVRVALTAAPSTWALVEDDFWCHAEPADHLHRLQGWKLHVSATPDSAAEITRRSARLLIEAGCAFKVARGIEQVESLVSGSSDRGSTGKVLTAYPADDESSVRLAALLHEATLGLPGPAILSDRAYLPGSLVHYRFGAYLGRSVLSNDGSYESMLIAPDGSLVKDERNGWFSPPTWVACPFDAPESVAAAGSVLIADRFEIHQAVRHSSKGGVFLGTDRLTGAEVVVKQARPHVLGLPGGASAADMLAREEQMLARLAPLGVTPASIGLFEHQNHLFLVLEKVAGETLAEHVERRFALDPADRPATDPIALALGIVDLVAQVHAAGMVLCDLSPNNVMVGPDGTVTLIDVEYAADAGAAIDTVVGTPGYSAPESRTTATFAADRYSLGALLFHLVSGVRPPECGPHDIGRLGLMVRQVAWRDLRTRRIAPAILGLLDADPTSRWDLVQTAAALRSEVRSWPAVAVSDQLGRVDLDRLIDDGLAHLLDTMQPAASALWPLGVLHRDGDPRNVQHGAAGVLAVLNQAAVLSADPRLHHAVRVGSHWLANRLETGDRLLPGLYFGASGAIWALHDVARCTDDAELGGRALALAAEIPVVWPNPDITHGAAGAGTAQLRLWQATGSAALEARVRACSDSLVAAATWAEHGVCWPIPTDFDSALAGMIHHGFAHGTAGIGAFLLAAGQALNEPAYLRLADAAGQSLAGLVTWDADRAWWPIGEEPDGNATRMAHWCSGSSGIGTFLIRLWQADGDARYRELAEGAARAVRSERWRMSTVHCHGLAGDGHYLLDLADALDEPEYRSWAAELAACLAVRAVSMDGRLLLTDEADEFSAAFGTGSAGSLSFLLRLREGGLRPWMVNGGQT